MGIFSNKQASQAKDLAKTQAGLAAAGIETVEAEKARTLAAEQARQNVFTSLGAPGTYGTPGTPGAPDAAMASPTGDIYQTDTTGKSPIALSQFSRGGGYTKEFADWESRAGILDPEKYGADVRKSAQFRIQSMRTAEAEQLLNREGKMWDELNNSVYGVISEGAATQWREDLRTIKNNAAKGGTARRTALKEAQQMQAQEKSNQAKVQQTWQANLALFDVVRKNADAVQQSNQAFMDNLPGIRSAYQQTMSNLANMMASVALPQSSTMQTTGFQAREAHPTTSTLSRIIGAVAGAAQGYMTGGGGWQGLAGGALGGFTGAMNQAPQGVMRAKGTRAQGGSGIYSPIAQGIAAGAAGGLLGNNILNIAGLTGSKADRENQAEFDEWMKRNA